MLLIPDSRKYCKAHVTKKLNIVKECDCLPAKTAVIGPDYGIIGGYNPVKERAEYLKMTGEEIFEKVLPESPGSVSSSEPKKSVPAYFFCLNLN
jgi:hypothetical protein